eukprot:2967264-Alexandrium_andersonii.AAC.1
MAGESICNRRPKHSETANSKLQWENRICAIAIVILADISAPPSSRLHPRLHGHLDRLAHRVLRLRDLREGAHDI